MSLLPLGKRLSNLCQRPLSKFNLVLEQRDITVKQAWEEGEGDRGGGREGGGEGGEGGEGEGGEEREET